MTMKMYDSFKRFGMLSYGIVGLGALATGHAFAQEVTVKESTPNIIFLMSDDQGFGDVGFNGHDVLKTPHLDAMAEEGIRFNRFYSASPLCSPSRASSITGRYPWRCGILAAHTGGMRIAEITTAEVAKEKSYATGFFGKWHMGWVKPEERSNRGYYSPPWHHGFDYSFCTTGAMPTWDPNVTPKGWKQWGQTPGQPWQNGEAYVENGKVVTDNLAGDDSRVIMDRVIPFVERSVLAKKPFLATVWFHTPHEPVVAGEKYRKMYADKSVDHQNYYGAITAMDEQIGRLRQKLRDLRIDRDTLIFFCSDNGPADGVTKKGIASAGKFRGHKHTMFEGGLRLPACAVWPGTITPGRVSEMMTGNIDYFPTVCDILGVLPHEEKPRIVDGISLLPHLLGKVEKRNKPMFFGFRRLYAGIDGQAYIEERFKIMKEANQGAEYHLFDLQNDPCETADLKESLPEVFDRLKKAMHEADLSCLQSRDGGEYPY